MSVKSTCLSKGLIDVDAEKARLRKEIAQGRGRGEKM